MTTTSNSDGELGSQFPAKEISPEASAPGGETRTGARISQWLFGQRNSYVLCRFIVVRGLALCFLIAFLSLTLQIDGLFSSRGILPIKDWLQGALVSLEGTGANRLVSFPTVFWFSSSDSFVQGAGIAGILFSLLALIGVMPAFALFVCWFLYLSFVTAGSEFLAYQWDILLLEAGFLVCLWAPWTMALPFLKRNTKSEGMPSLLTLWALRWLLFKLMVMSGLCKLMSGDLTWVNWSALTYHYETQPLPTPLAWIIHSCPLWFHQFSCLLMFGTEIFCPLLIFGNRLCRSIACGALITLQSLILLTGNYTFFNLLSIILCLTLLDDCVWQKVMPTKWYDSVKNAASPAESDSSILRRLRDLVVLFLVSTVIFSNASLFLLRSPFDLPSSSRILLAFLQPFHIVSSYGLFAVMTTKRIEIILEGSDDGKVWQPYEFKYKPGDLNRPPPVVAPFQPRLDWQMWFAALSSLQDNQWFVAFVKRVLEGDRSVTRLLEGNPFPDNPPKYLRALSYEYHFSSPQDLLDHGHWWRREYVGVYMPPVSLKALPQ